MTKVKRQAPQWCLEDLLALLHQNTNQLVDDSDPAKAIFKTLRGQIPADAEEILFQATHLESRQLQYQKATQCLADRTAYVLTVLNAHI